MKARNKLILCLLVAFATAAAIGPIVNRLRDLQDVRLSVTPSNGQTLVYDSSLSLWTNGAASGGGGMSGVTNQNTTQFATNGGTLSIKSGAAVTNLHSFGTQTNSSIYGDNNFTWDGIGFFTDTLGVNLLQANNAQFTNTPTVLGSPVLTNAPGSGLTNSGMTLNTLQKATGTNSIGDSSIIDDGSGNFQFGAVGLSGITVFPPSNPSGNGTSLLFLSGASGGMDVDGGNITFTATDANGNGNGGSLTFTAGQGDAGGGNILIEAPNNGASVTLSSPGTDGTAILNTDTVIPSSGATTLLGTKDNTWLDVHSEHGTFYGGLAVTNDLILDGALKMTGALTISGQTGFPYADDGTQLTRNGQPVGVTISQNGTNGAPVVNFTNSPTVTWARSGSNWTATAASGGTSVYVNGTNVSNPNLKDTADIVYALAASTNIQPSLKAQAFVNLTFSSSTNLNTMDCSLGSSDEVHFYTVLTNSAFLGTPSNIPTTVKHIWYHLQQDGTGLRTLTMTNGTFAHPAQVPFVLSTNASAVDIIEMITDPFTNTVINVVGTQNFKR